MSNIISRRELLKRAGIAGAAAAVPAIPAVPEAAQRPAQNAAPAAAPLAREPLEALTATEAEILEAFAARLIPSDANGPGATEARATRYIDRALAGALASSRPAYTSGLAALDTYARSSKGGPFIRLSAADQDAVLRDLEAGKATGFASSREFFALVRAHTIQGTFCDPYYGGNANFVGWDLIGYPGVRTMVTASEQQQLEKHTLKPARRSAYDHDAFNKASAQNLPRRSAREEGA